MSGTRETRTILIVDDEERLRKGLARSLSGKDRRTFTAASGEEALSVLKGRKVDLVITDLIMPGMDGMTLVGNIRSAVPGIEVIIITAYGSAESMKEAEEIGVASYLAKPFDLADLKSKVDECLSKKPASNGPVIKKRVVTKPASNGPACQPVRLRLPACGSAPLECAVFKNDPAWQAAAVGDAASSVRVVGTRALEKVHEAPGVCPKGHRVLCSICLAGGKALKTAAGLSRKAFPYVSPRKVMLAVGRAARAASRLSLRRLLRGR